jgi:Flp pilus assembly protein TadB
LAKRAARRSVTPNAEKAKNMKLKRAMAVIGFIAVYVGPGLFFILAVALGMNASVAVCITLGAVIVMRFVFNMDY